MKWLALTLAASTTLAAQSEPPPPATAFSGLLDSLRPRAERAVVEADWRALDAVTARLRGAIATPDGQRDAWLHYDLAYALHRRASAMIIDERAREAKPLLEEAVAMAARSRTLGGGAHATALEGTVTGQLAGASGALKAMRLGPRAFRLLDEAVAAAPQDPRVALMNGITRLNAPRAFGGGPEKGEPELRRAIRLFGGDRNRTPLPQWGRVDAHIWLGIALFEMERHADARVELQRALAMEPSHRWVSTKLLPELDRIR